MYVAYQVHRGAPLIHGLWGSPPTVQHACGLHSVSKMLLFTKCWCTEVRQHKAISPGLTAGQIYLIKCNLQSAYCPHPGSMSVFREEPADQWCRKVNQRHHRDKGIDGLMLRWRHYLEQSDRLLCHFPKWLQHSEVCPPWDMTNMFTSRRMGQLTYRCAVWSVFFKRSANWQPTLFGK